MNINNRPTIRGFNFNKMNAEIMCVGVDNKKHACSPEASTAKCGTLIKRKKPLRDDYKLYSCYECTY